MRFASRFFLASAVVLPVVLNPADGADLTGYGSITMAVTREGTGGGTVVLTCEDDLHAERLLSKLRADLTWDRLLGLRELKLSGDIPAYHLDGFGVLVLAQKGTVVTAVAASTQAAASARLTGFRLTGNDTRFVPRTRHPASLDFFDLQPISMYEHPLNVLDLEKGWKRYDREVLGRTCDFWAPFGFGQANFHPYFGADELADGAAHFFPVEHAIDRATRRGMGVMAHLGQYWAPWWLRNRFPEDIVQWDPHVISGWNPLGAMAGTHVSQHASGEAYAYVRRFTTKNGLQEWVMLSNAGRGPVDGLTLSFPLTERPAHRSQPIPAPVREHHAGQSLPVGQAGRAQPDRVVAPGARGHCNAAVARREGQNRHVCRTTVNGARACGEQRGQSGCLGRSRWSSRMALPRCRFGRT